MKDTKNDAAIAGKALIAIIGILLIADLVITGLLYTVAVPNEGTRVLINAVLLAAIAGPAIYWLVFRPLRRELDQRATALPTMAAVAEPAADTGQLTLTDPLTRIMNRRGITMGLLDAMAQSQRYGDPLAVAIADVDHLQQVNSKHGQDTGDKVLATMAAVMSEMLRMPDKVGRYGGEEFLIILPHTALTPAKKISERVRSAVEQWTFDINGVQIKQTVSIGLTQFRKGEDLEQLLSRVDKALAQAKAEGCNRVVTQKAASSRSTTH
ncbi:MAG: GGDEF domain-containing protein [Gammaproteobacteria bacterium]|nr:GGDEF domain-containing protein [Gammaproteobacteria bacterium]